MSNIIGKLLTAWRIRAVRPFVRGRLLDVGCGANGLVRQHGNGVGIDRHQLGNVDLVVEDAASIPFEDSSFDSISLLASLNYLPDKDKALREYYRLLKSDGRLIITMIPPTVSRYWHMMRDPFEYDQNKIRKASGEAFGISKNDMLSLLKRNGYKIQRTIRFMLLLNTIYICEKNS